MKKSEVIDLFLEQLRDQHGRTIAALAEAAEGATGDDSKAESKYDTRGLESSYLAAGQASQAEELAGKIATLERFDFPAFGPQDSIDVGALVELEFEGELEYYLIAPGGSGQVCSCLTGETVTVIGPEAPLSKQLIGKKAGESAGESGISRVLE